MPIVLAPLKIEAKKKQKNTDKDLHNTTEKTEDLATGIQQTK